MKFIIEYKKFSYNFIVMINIEKITYNQISTIVHVVLIKRRNEKELENKIRGTKLQNYKYHFVIKFIGYNF